MSKKSYKRNQNRLYREIKRRLIAENKAKALLRAPIKPIIQTVKTDKIRIKDQISYDIVYGHANSDFEELSNHFRRDLIRRLMDGLVDKGYIEFYLARNDDAQAMEIMTEIEIVRREERR